MSQVIERIAVNDIPKELAGRGLSGSEQVRIVVDRADQIAAARDITAVNAASESFKFLEDEPDLYTDADLIERNA